MTSAFEDSVGRMGTGFMSAPSTRSWSPDTTGVNSDGMAIDARIALLSDPSWNQTSRWASTSVATAV